MEQEVQPFQLLSPNGENGIYSTCSEAFDEILSHLPEAGNPAPKAEWDVVSDDEDEEEDDLADKIENSTTREEKEVENVSLVLPVFIQDWKTMEKAEIKVVPSSGIDEESKDKWKSLNGDVTADDDVLGTLDHTEIITRTTPASVTTDDTSIQGLTSKDIQDVDRSKEVTGVVETETNDESCVSQTEFSRLDLSSGQRNLTELQDADVDEATQQPQQDAQQEDTVFTVQFQVSASIVELPDEENSSDDDATSKNGSEETVLREDHISGDTKSSPDDVDGQSFAAGDAESDRDLEKTYIYEIFQPMEISDDQTGSPPGSRDAHLTRVMMRIRDQEIDGCIERRSLGEDSKETKELEKNDPRTPLPNPCDEKMETSNICLKEGRDSLGRKKISKEDKSDESLYNERSHTKEVRIECSVDRVKNKFKEDYTSAFKARKAIAAAEWASNIQIPAGTPTTSDSVVETSKKIRTPSSSVPIVVKGESSKGIKDDEMPAPNSTKVLLAKFKSLEREGSLQRSEKDKHSRSNTKSSNMTLSTSSLSGSFDRHSHSSGKQLAGRQQAHVGTELTYPSATRSPSESVCSSDWDTESYGSDILQQHLLQSTQHLASKEGDEKEESVLLTKSLLAQWKLLEEHERRLKQLEKSEKGLSASDAKIRSRSLGRLQSSIEKKISLLETPDGSHPFDSDVLDTPVSLSKSLTLPKTSKPSQMRNDSPASLKDQFFVSSRVRSDSIESLQRSKAKDLQQYLPPPFVTRYVLAKFKELENKSQADSSLSTDSTKKTYKWEVKEASPIGTNRGTTVEFRYRKPGSYEPFYRRSYSEEPRRIHFGMKAQDVISEEGQPSNVKYDRSPTPKVNSESGNIDLKSSAEKVDSDFESKASRHLEKGDSLEEAKHFVMKSYREKHEPKQSSTKVVKSLLSYFNSLEEDKEKVSEKK